MVNLTQYFHVMFKSLKKKQGKNNYVLWNNHIYLCNVVGTARQTQIIQSRKDEVGHRENRTHSF